MTDTPLAGRLALVTGASRGIGAATAVALASAGAKGARLCLGVAFMLLVAAFIEAFWSSTQSIPAAVKYSVSGVLWSLVAVWLGFGGRGVADAD